KLPRLVRDPRNHGSKDEVETFATAKRTSNVVQTADGIGKDSVEKKGPKADQLTILRQGSVALAIDVVAEPFMHGDNFLETFPGFPRPAGEKHPAPRPRRNWRGVALALRVRWGHVLPGGC